MTIKNATDLYEIRTWYSVKYECFLAQCTEIDGVLTDGKTPQEAVKNAHMSLAAFLEAAAEEGWPIPAPKNKPETSRPMRPANFGSQAVKQAAARLLARSGGRSKSPAKAAAARRNGRLGGRLGGRPKKKAAA